MQQPAGSRRDANLAAPAAAGARVDAFLRMKKIGRSFGSIVALHALDLDISAGEFLTILGPSGSGKSTTLNLIAGFDFPTAGEIFIGGRDVTWEPSYSRDIGMVFQNYALFPHMTVFENIAFPLRSRRFPSAEIDRIVERTLALVQLDEMRQRLPRQLSGGQQQRVALARAFVYRPAVLLMDEPLGALDRKLRADMQIEIKSLHRELGTTIIYVTHDQDEALSMSDRIAVLHQGCLEQCAPPHEMYAKPASKFVASFVGDANFFSATVVRNGEAVAQLHEFPVRIPLGPASSLQSGARVSVCARPEHLRLTAATSMNSHVRLEQTLFLGDSIKCILRHRDIRIMVKVPVGQSHGIPAMHGDVGFEIDVGACTVFPDAS
jgi:putative spermidine/putrescine transport system ATP-binding protein